MSMETNKRTASFITILSLLILILLSACSKNTSGVISYKTFYSQEGDPPFSFQYPGNYRVLYEPTPSDDVSFEIERVETFSGLIHASAGIIDEPGEPADPEKIVESRISKVSAQEYTSDFRVLERGTVWINNIETQYASYAYSHDKYNEIEVHKHLVFEHDGLTWDVITVCSDDTNEEWEAVFWRFIATFRFLD